MLTFTAADSPDLKVYDPRSGQSATFKDGRAQTDDADLADALRRTPGVIEEPSKDALLDKARDLDVKGASRMPKDELKTAVDQAQNEHEGATGA